MKPTLLVLALLLACLPALGQTPVTVSGTITDAGNNPATSGFVQFDIQPRASSVQYFVAGTTTIASQTTQCGINNIGVLQNITLSGPCLVWGNDIITPGNTTYKVTFAPNGNITGAVNGECLSGSSYNLSNPVFCPLVQITPQQAMIRSNPFQVNIIPNANNVFNIGSPTAQYAAGYFSQIFLGGTPLSPTPFGLGTNNTWTGINNFNGVTNLNGGGSIGGTWSGTPTITGIWTFSGRPVFTQSIGLSPFTVVSTTQVTNLNAQFLGGLSAPASAILGLTDTQSPTNKTLDASLNTFKWSSNTVGHYLRNNGTQYVDSTIQSADLPATTSNCTNPQFAQGLNAGGTPICATPVGAALISGACGGTFSSNATSGIFGLGKNTSTSCSNVEVNLDFGPVMPSSGTIKNLRVKCGTGGSGAGSGVVTVRLNAGTTSLTCTTGTGTTCNDTTHSFAVVAGDQLGSQTVTVGAETLANCSIVVEKQ